MIGPSIRAALGGLAVLLAAALGAAAEPARITFLHTNDVTEIEPIDGIGGIAELAALLQRERQAAAHSITTFGGDLISPSVMSALTKGAHMVALYGALGTDAAVLGNHEFDFGPKVAAERVRESAFPWLGSNVLDPDGGVAVGAQASLLLEVGGYRIGLFGLLTPGTATQSSPGPDIVFAPLVETARRMVADLQAQGAEVIVALTHLDLDDDRLLAREVPGIDLILGGHDHNPIDFVENGVLIHKSGQNAQYLGIVELTIERLETAGGMTVTAAPAWRVVPVAGIEPDPAIAAMVAANRALLEAELAQPIGRTAVALDARQATVRARESNLGNLFADAMRRHHAADAAILNGGAIRSDRVYPPGTELTRRDVVATLPFSNTVALLDVSGADLRATLEHAVSTVERGAGRFPQISGLAFVFDPAQPPGARILSVTVGGQSLDPAARYRLAVNDYMARGGDGFATLAAAPRIVEPTAGPLLATAVLEHIAAQPAPLAPRVEGRIRTVR